MVGAIVGLVVWKCVIAQDETKLAGYQDVHGNAHIGQLRFASGHCLLQGWTIKFIS